MMVRERSREFAVLRLVGASGSMLSRMALLESALCGLIGGIAGIGLSAVGIFSFSALIEQSLGLPYLMPGLPAVLLLAGGTLLLSAAVSALAGAFAARRLSRVSPGIALRAGN